MPVCTNCGSDVKEAASLCPSCGLPAADEFADQSTLSMPFSNADEERLKNAKTDPMEHTLEVMEDTEEAYPVDHLPPATSENIKENTGSVSAAATPIKIPAIEKKAVERVITNDIAPDEPRPTSATPASEDQTASIISASREDGKTSGLKALSPGIVLNSRYE